MYPTDAGAANAARTLSFAARRASKARPSHNLPQMSLTHHFCLGGGKVVG